MSCFRSLSFRRTSVGRPASGTTSAATLLLNSDVTGSTPTRTGDGPEDLPTPQGHEAAITRTAVIPGSPAEVFSFIAAEDVLPKVLTGYGPLPAVVRTSENTGPWDVPGSARLVHLADGSTVREQITLFAAPDRFSYRVWEFGNLIVRALATEARGEWLFEAAPGGTLATWTYTFTAKNRATLLPLAIITRALWRGYMDVCLENARRMMTQAIQS